MFSRMRHPGPEVAMLLSMVCPGLGHACLGLHRRGLLTALGFVMSAGVAAWMALEEPLRPWLRDLELFYALSWSALALWFFAMADAYEAARCPASARGPNPRVAFVLNFCTRGIGYFYVERPVAGALALLALPAILRLGPALLPHDEAWGGSVVIVCLLHGLLGLDAYRSAQAMRGRTSAVPCPPHRLLAPAATLLVASWLAARLLALGTEAMMPQTVQAPQPVTAPDRIVVLKRAGLEVTLPLQWRVQEDIDTLAALIAPGARIVVLDDRAPESGVDGYIVALAGQLTRQYGPVHLTQQKALETPGFETREICYSWKDRDFVCHARLYLLSRGDEIKTFLVSAPEPMAAPLQAEIEAVVRSVRFLPPQRS